MIGGYNDIMITLSSTATLPFIQTIVVYTKTHPISIFTLDFTKYITSR
jgi:hypothetical protein